MPVDYYVSKSENELLLLLDSLQRRATQGVIASTSAAGVQQIRSFTQGSRVETEIKRVLYSLFKRNPIDYSDPYASMIRRTRAHYTFS